MIVALASATACANRSSRAPTRMPQATAKGSETTFQAGTCDLQGARNTIEAVLDALSKGDLPRLDELFAPDGEFEAEISPEIPKGKLLDGRVMSNDPDIDVRSRS
ncbi:MAG TPA: hypothetical protein VH951_02285, partial [Dehalococcoidia bacterium]